MRKTSRHHLVSRLLALVLLVFFSAAIPASANEYDPNRPENLEGRNLRATSAIVIEQSTGEVLFEKNADEVRPPASTTKVMTALLALTMGAPDEMVTVSDFAANVPEDASKIGLKAGEQLSLGDLIRATMVASGNDGAIAIAEHLAGSETAFVQLMNEAANRFGCARTNFVNSHGYHDDYHVSTARDLAIIAREAMMLPEFREIAQMTSYTLPATNLSEARRLTSQDSVLMNQGEENNYYYPYAVGIKTGRTSLAGWCYIGAGSKQGVNLISVILNSGSTARWTDTKKLLEYGFTQFVTTTISEIYSYNQKIINISSFSLDDSDLGRLQLNLRKQDPLANDTLISRKGSIMDENQVFASRTQVEFTRSLDAPVEAGEIMGILTYTPLQPGTEPVFYDLLAARSIPRRPSLAPTLDEIRAYTDADPNPFPRFSLEFLMIILLPIAGLVLALFLLFKLLTRKRKPKVKQKLEYKTRYYR